MNTVYVSIIKIFISMFLLYIKLEYMKNTYIDMMWF